jgi:hypothetical protein
MKFRALLAGAMLAMLFGGQAHAVRIANDKGGQIGPYLDAFLNIRNNTAEQVIIDGPCLSACTIVLGIIPRERLCVTRRAQFGFHAAWNPGRDGRPVLSQAGTKALWDLYPGEVRAWLKKKGGLKPQMVILSGPELMAMYPACGDDQPRARNQTAPAIKPPHNATTAIAR